MLLIMDSKSGGCETPLKLQKSLRMPSLSTSTRLTFTQRLLASSSTYTYISLLGHDSTEISDVMSCGSLS